MDSIWLGLSPGARSTRVLAMRGPSETILKAHLSPEPASARAVTALLEAIALWEGRPVHAALAAAESSTSSCKTTLYRDLFEVFGETPLYRLQWADAVAGPLVRLLPVLSALQAVIAKATRMQDVA